MWALKTISCHVTPKALLALQQQHELTKWKLIPPSFTHHFSPDPGSKRSKSFWGLLLFQPVLGGQLRSLAARYELQWQIFRPLSAHNEKPDSYSQSTGNVVSKSNGYRIADGRHALWKQANSGSPLLGAINFRQMIVIPGNKVGLELGDYSKCGHNILKSES